MTDLSLPALREAVAKMTPGCPGLVWETDVAGIVALRNAVPALLDELETLRQRVNEDNEVCLCGCPPEAHECYEEDGESCENETHTCLRVCRSVAAEFEASQKALSAERIEVAHLREAFVTMERAANQHETERDRALADLDDAATAINEAMDILGLAGIDQPITVVDAARSRMADLAAVRVENEDYRAALATTEQARDRWHQKYTVEAQARQDEVKILGAELIALREEVTEMAKGASHDCDIIADGADTEEQLRADLMGQRDAYALLADDLAAERIEIAHLREAFVTMEQAANQHESSASKVNAFWSDPRPPLSYQQRSVMKTNLEAARFCYLEGWHDASMLNDVDFDQAWAAWQAQKT